MTYPSEIVHWIAGKETAGESGAYFNKFSPASGEVLSRVIAGDTNDIDLAIQAASQSYPNWSNSNTAQRADLVAQAANLLEQKSRAAAEIISLESGKSEIISLGEVNWAVKMGQFWASQADRFDEVEVLKSSVAKRRVQMIRQSLGPGVLITPFNNPLAGIASKVFPALLCGNTIVLKSHEDTPYIAVWFGKILKEAGLPQGVYNVVQGKGSDIGTPLVTDKRVQFVSFTGSVATAQTIIKASADRLTKTMVEAGGKNPIIICDDANLEKAVEAAVGSGFIDTGQRCASGSRVIVMREVYDQFKEMYLAKVKSLKSGTGNSDDLGAIINQRRLDEILLSVEEAVRKGATLLCGGKRIDRPGFFMEPTVLENVGPNDKISKAEVFGPVVILYQANDFDEAINLANDADYKLTGAIHTSDLKKGMTFIKRYIAGVARVNGPTHGSEPHTPFGGLGLSGNGWKETGWQAMNFYSDLKQVSFDD
ncbi:MAG: aldehyde dehydrogenase [Candidatus Buchananbacteria bacterium CG10_big_fil_rev_8_21_14_0_10_42_9]|uniref:Aldehyde dehydrogenase n=1 Tax=Candidatus Buchananbacteria bacterium CG10_big_fil_rev_8_21_14_0_10_42_9 TaxID=1974526 RepID=A0A2H0W1N4_9BACT|nr:MAG: aldehyde dehydrogenase [Candidatus Buchananbacteria bacterium CG10_big_fil_rev_8_21_14_0_10_42_9]